MGMMLTEPSSPQAAGESGGDQEPSSSNGEAGGAGKLGAAAPQEDERPGQVSGDGSQEELRRA